MLYDRERIGEVVVVDPPRRRYRLLLPISPVAASETAQLRNAYAAAIEGYIAFRFAKVGVAAPGAAFDPLTAVADAAGWFPVPL